MKMTPELAEICGIHAGDGHIKNTGRELEISGSVEEKEYYDKHVIPLFNKVFGTNIKGRFFKTKGTYGFWTTDRRIINELMKRGFPKGAKSDIVKTPITIVKSKSSEVRRAFLRGVFDTDGCISFCKKIGNKDPFKVFNDFYPSVLFSSVSKQLACQVQTMIVEDIFNCKMYVQLPRTANESKQYRQQICGAESLNNWMLLIKSRNYVKVSRYLIWVENGFCPTCTTLKERIRMLNGEYFLEPVLSSLG